MWGASMSLEHSSFLLRHYISEYILEKNTHYEIQSSHFLRHHPAFVSGYAIWNIKLIGLGYKDLSLHNWQVRIFYSFYSWSVTVFF